MKKSHLPCSSPPPLSPAASWPFSLATLCAIVLATNCGSKATESGGTDTGTNWVTSCERAMDCEDGTVCRCNVCTSVCEQDSDCRALSPTAVCEAAPTRCEAGRICVPPKFEFNEISTPPTRMACSGETPPQMNATEFSQALIPYTANYQILSFADLVAASDLIGMGRVTNYSEGQSAQSGIGTSYSVIVEFELEDVLVGEGNPVHVRFNLHPDWSIELWRSCPDIPTETFVVFLREVDPTQPSPTTDAVLMGDPGYPEDAPLFELTNLQGLALVTDDELLGVLDELNSPYAQADAELNNLPELVQLALASATCPVADVVEGQPDSPGASRADVSTPCLDPTCNPLGPVEHDPELHDVMLAARAEDGATYVVDDGSDYRVYRSEGDVLVPLDVVGRSIGETTRLVINAEEGQLTLMFEPQDEPTRAAVFEGRLDDDPEFDPRMPDWTQGEALDVLDTDVASDFELAPLVSAMLIEYRGWSELGHDVVVVRPERDFVSDDDFRLFFSEGTAQPLVERGLTLLVRKGDGGSTRFDFLVDGITVSADFPASLDPDLPDPPGGLMLGDETIELSRTGAPPTEPSELEFWCVPNTSSRWRQSDATPPNY